MTDAGNQFALRVHVVHEFIGRSVAADVIRSVSSGNHDTVEVRCPQFVVRFPGFDRVAQFAGIGLARFGADNHNFSAGLLKAEIRVPDFHLLVHDVHQNSDSFPFEFHDDFHPSVA